MVEPAPMPPRLFFELTLSQRLVGQPPVGIVRTEVRLASHLLHSRPGLYHFCVFHADLGEFVALDRDETIAILGSAPTRRGPSDDPAIVPRNGWLEHRVKRPARLIRRSLKARILARLPPSLIEFGQSARALGIAAMALCRSLVDYARDAITTLPPPADDRLPIDFRRGDVLITVGMAWQDGFLTRLLAKKQEHGIKVVMFCHDLIPIDFPHLVAPSEVAFFQKCYADLVGCADKILCNSSYTRDRLVHFLANFNHRPILATLELGSDLLPATTDDWPAGLPPLRPGRFVLCVSTVEIRKNHRLIYHLWSRLNETEPALLLPLVCVGGPGWRTDDLMRLIAADRHLRGKLILLRGLPDGDLGWLYRHCAFTLYPSFVEGWGLPVAESLSYGKYCVASTAPSIAELSRGLLDLLDPLDFAAWHREIRRLLAEPGYLRAKERRIATYRPRDWASAGEQFVAETAAFR